MIPGEAAEYYRMLSGQYLMGITWSVLRAKADTMGNHIIIMTWEAFYTISETKRSSVIWEQENIQKNILDLRDMRFCVIVPEVTVCQ